MAGRAHSTASGQITAPAASGNGWPAMASPIPVPNALAYPRPAMSRRPGWPSRPSGSASRKWKLIAMTSGPASVASTRAA